MKTVYKNYDNIFNAEQNNLEPLFVCSENLIDWDMTDDLKHPVFLTQAIATLLEANKQGYCIMLLEDKNPPRKKETLSRKYEILMKNYKSSGSSEYIHLSHAVAIALQHFSVPVCMTYSIGYRSSDTSDEEGYVYTYSSISGLLWHWHDETDISRVRKYTFVGSGVKRKLCLSMEFANRFGVTAENIEHYQSLTDFENALIRQDPSYLATIEGIRTEEKREISSGEKYVQNWLAKHGYRYEPQFTFPDCRDKHVLPFDFVVNIKGNIRCIEYDGVQHKEAVDYFGGEERLSYVQYHDRLKNEYCKSRNIPLLRLSGFKKEDLNQKLEDFLKT